jgi:DUF1680 family protein
MKRYFLCFYWGLMAWLPVMGQKPVLKAFPLSSVRLLNSPFKEAQETDKYYILSLDADRLLAPFLREAGLPAKAESYGNWENTGLDGHIGGHYLSALANMYAATGDRKIGERLDYTVTRLEKCQQNSADGYVGGIPGSKKLWQEIAEGKIDAGSFSLNKKWVPLYNIHKLFAGLADAYTIAGNEKAKKVLVKLSDWFIGVTENLSDAQLQTILRSEHGGLNEVFADVAAITGEQKYLTLAKRLSHQSLLRPLLQNKDSLNGLHANTQIPKVIGYMRIAQLMENKEWTDAARFFWNTVTKNRTISIGGNSVREHFHPAHDFSSMIETREGPETCNTYNMLKLSKLLFTSEPSSIYMDYYERAVYNHILSSQHPKGGFVYFTPIRPQHYRVYSSPQQSFWCCVGTGLENHGKYGEMIYAHNDKDLFINLFIPSQLTWKEKGLVLKQETNFPNSEKTSFQFALAVPKTFAVSFRHPSWVVNGKVKVWINNKEVEAVQNKNGYVTLQRQWKNGDVLSLQLPMQVKTEFLPDGSPWFSFVRGPIVLAAATDTTAMVGIKADDSRMGHIASGPLYPIEKAPMIVSESKDLSSALQPVAGKPFTFTASKLIYPDSFRNLQLVPFYTIHDTRYMVYWRFATPDQLHSIREELRKAEEERLALETITVDYVAPGEQQPESDHGFKGENTESGVFRERHWRHSKGWFSYDLKNGKGEGRRIRITYSGSDKNRTFDLFVNGMLLQTVKLDGEAGNKFFDVDYPLPESMITEPKETITVKFVAHPGSIAGEIFGVRLVK